MNLYQTSSSPTFPMESEQMLLGAFNEIPELAVVYVSPVELFCKDKFNAVKQSSPFVPVVNVYDCCELESVKLQN